jgi:hypothetical protein
MEFITYLYALFTWLILALLASVNGWVRNKLYKKSLGELTAHQLSTIIFIGVIFFVSYFFVKWVGIDKPIDLWMIGISWLVLTVIFEFIFGHYVWKHPWGKLLHDYNIRKGRLWILVLVATLIAPYVVYLLI